MTTPQILIVDDECEIRSFVRLYLERDGYRVIEASNGEEGLMLAKQGVDLVILDLMMPGIDGLEVTRLLRASSLIPILILTARGEEADRVVGLEIGADDYLTKPFSPRELVARVKALVRRSRMPTVGSIASGRLVIDATHRQISFDGVPIELTPREYDLLRTLVANPGKNFTREELLNRVWGEEYVGDFRRVDVHICKIREKLVKEGKTCPVRSIWGVGYRYEP
jgi:two-component system, OmpR family, response regulator ResD